MKPASNEEKFHTMTNISLFKYWYETNIAIGRDSFEKYQYHLNKQLSGLDFKGKRILEIGCGQGAVSLYMALFVGADVVVAMDENAGEGSNVGVLSTLEGAKNHFELDNIDIVELDFLKNSFPDGHFDIIISNNALHHVITPGLISKNEDIRYKYVTLFTEIYRLLKPGGVLSIYEYSRKCFWRWFPLKPKKFYTIDWEIHPTTREWESVIKSANFEKITCRFHSPYLLKFFGIITETRIFQYFSYTGFDFLAYK